MSPSQRHVCQISRCDFEERADRITEEIRRTRGVMEEDRFQALLHDDDDA